VTWTLDNAFPLMVAHLARLAKSPAWRADVAHTIAQLEADQTGIWKGIRQAVNEAVKASKAGQAKTPESERQTPKKSL
jgi:hypothetical protein